MSAKVAIQAGAPPPAHLGHSTGGSSSGGSGGGPSSTSSSGASGAAASGSGVSVASDSTASGASSSGVSTLTFSSQPRLRSPDHSVIVHDHFDTAISGAARRSIVSVEWARVRKSRDLHIATLKVG